MQFADYSIEKIETHEHYGDLITTKSGKQYQMIQVVDTLEIDDKFEIVDKLYIEELSGDRYIKSIIIRDPDRDISELEPVSIDFLEKLLKQFEEE